MYTFYTDKMETFECKLNLQGAKLSNSKARLVLESDTYNLMFYGTLNESGKCTIPVAKLKNLLSESDSGNVKLEVIAEDTFFEPWSDKYDVRTSKKVTVEVLSKSEGNVLTEKKVSVTMDTPSNRLDELTDLFFTLAEKKDVKLNLYNLKEHAIFITKICGLISDKYKLKNNEPKQLAENIINKLI